MGVATGECWKIRSSIARQELIQQADVRRYKKVWIYAREYDICRYFLSQEFERMRIFVTLVPEIQQEILGDS